MVGRIDRDGEIVTRRILAKDFINPSLACPLDSEDLEDMINGSRIDK
jgi:hypothetical protein